MRDLGSGGHLELTGELCCTDERKDQRDQEKDEYRAASVPPPSNTMPGNEGANFMKTGLKKGRERRKERG